MKKILLVLSIMMIVLSSCRGPVTSSCLGGKVDQLIITKINHVSKTTCEYDVTPVNENGVFSLDIITFIDSVGKYNLSDTINNIIVKKDFTGNKTTHNIIVKRILIENAKNKTCWYKVGVVGMNLRTLWFRDKVGKYSIGQKINTK